MSIPEDVTLSIYLGPVARRVISRYLLDQQATDPNTTVESVIRSLFNNGMIAKGVEYRLEDISAQEMANSNSTAAAAKEWHETADAA